MKVAVVLAGLACGCSRPASVVAESKGTATGGSPVDAVPHLREADDTARFVAGLPGRTGSPFADLETGAAWKEHRRLLDAAWQKADTAMLGGLHEFHRELQDVAPDNVPVWYPFGGPDALMPTICFPRSPAYILVGLEPAGTLPPFAEVRKKNLERYLRDLRTTMASDLGRSFFVTREMDRQFRGQVTDGLLLPILHLLVRTDHTILGFRYVRLDDSGQPVDRPANYRAAPGDPANKGVEIEFRTDADQSIHKLSYFSVNLADVRLRGNDPFLRYVKTLKGATTLLKATSYMTHRAEFSQIRDLVLSTSGAILQDDSGIPYHWFTAAGWRVQLYGDYNRPYGSFRWLEQPDLRKAYREAGVKPLPMHVGYGFRRIASNLLLAKRTTTLP